MTKYCRDNVICLNGKCQRPHYKKFDERQVLAELFSKLNGEDGSDCQIMAEHMEPINLSKATCRYHLLCFERECGFSHSGFALENRKLLIKAFKKHSNQMKAKCVIEDDMTAKRLGKSTPWVEMVKD